MGTDDTLWAKGGAGRSLTLTNLAAYTEAKKARAVAVNISGGAGMAGKQKEWMPVALQIARLSTSQKKVDRMNYV